VFIRMKRTVDTRFWCKVDKDTGFAREGMTPCWIWTGADDGRSTTGEGYGKFKYGEKYVRAHRVAYILTHGEIAPGLSIMHMCDNPKCVNPEHLKPGTHKENMADKIAKGRGSGWRKKQNVRLTREQVLEICASDKPTRLLAREYGLMSPASIRSIRNGTSYSDITHSLRTSLQTLSPVVIACMPSPPQSPSQSGPCELP